MNKKAISVKNDSILMTSKLKAGNVNSRKTQDVSWLINSIKKILNMYEASPKTWGIYRRYSFQLEINSCENALLTALQIKSALKSTENIDFRIGIGIGKKEFSTSKITESNGEAFINSGFAFDNYLKKQHLAIKTP